MGLLVSGLLRLRMSQEGEENYPSSVSSGHRLFYLSSQSQPFSPSCGGLSKMKTKLLMDWPFLDQVRETEIVWQTPFPFSAQSKCLFKMEIRHSYQGRVVPRFKSEST
jgi:hypothetical protein